MVKWTFVFLIACVVIFFLQITGIIDWRYFAFTPALALEMPWTFITSMFLHANFAHLFFNMFALFMFGLFLESRVGSNNFLLIYFLSGMAGSIGYMITATDPMIPALGASGAIYGIIGALAILTPFLMVWVMGMVPMPMIAVAFIWGIMEFLGVFAPGSGIAHGAHLGGLFLGVFYGMHLRKTEKRRWKKYKYF